MIGKNTGRGRSEPGLGAEQVQDRDKICEWNGRLRMEWQSVAGRNRIKAGQGKVRSGSRSG